MFRSGIFKVLSNLFLLMVVGTSPVTAASDSGTVNIKINPPDSNTDNLASLSTDDWAQIKTFLPPAALPPPFFQQAYLKASNTESYDYFGISASLSGDTLVVGAYQEDSNATGVNGDETDNSAFTAGAAYVFIRTGGVWSQQAYLKASNTEIDDFFGTTVSISGDTIVVGAYGEDSNATGVNGNQANNSSLDSGAVYVFTRSGTTWSQQAYLKASNTETEDRFGNRVSISGNTLVVGAFNEDSSATGVNGNQADNSGNDSGAVYVFTRSGTTWSQQAYLKASNTEANDRFGTTVSISGETLVVGAVGEASNAVGINGSQTDNSALAAGAAYVFTRSGTTWSQQAYLKASNTQGSDYFGYAVSVSIDTIVVGAYGEDSNATGVNGNQANNSGNDSGAAYVFTRSGTIWSQQAYLKASNTEPNDNFAHESFGSTVSIDGDIIVVGASGEDSNATGINGNQANNSAINSGAAYVFTRSTGIWSQQSYLKASNTEAGDGFGFSVSISGETIAVTASYEAFVSGATYVFKASPPNIMDITATDANPDLGSSANFVITFSEPMIGVDTSDFSVVMGGGISGVTITGVSGSGNTYTISVNIGVGNGTIRLDVPISATITDLSGNSLGNIPFTIGRTYNVNKPIPKAPILRSPRTNTLTSDTTPTFWWANVKDGQTYEIVFSSNSSFTTTVHTNTNAVSPYTPPAFAEGTYYWRVRASSINNELGDWSSPRSIMIDTTGPLAPVLSSPTNSASVNRTPTFKWLPSSTAVLYEFQYDDNAGFSSPNYTVTVRGTSRKPPAMPGGTYYWHVRAKDTLGNWSVWSSQFTITITGP